MTFSIPLTLAQTTAAATSPGGFLSFPILMILLFGVMYFIMIRPQMKRQKEQKAMLGALAKGDEVVTTGGMAGRIEELGDAFLTVEVSPGVRVKLQKGAVSQVLPKGTLKAS